MDEHLVSWTIGVWLWRPRRRKRREGEGERHQCWFDHTLVWTSMPHFTFRIGNWKWKKTKRKKVLEYKISILQYFCYSTNEYQTCSSQSCKQKYFLVNVAKQYFLRLFFVEQNFRFHLGIHVFRPTAMTIVNSGHVLEKLGSNQLQVSLNSTQPSNMSSDELAIKYKNLVQLNILSPDELALVSLDNVSLVENSILEGNSSMVENSSLVERILLVGNSTNWRDQLDFPLLQVSVCGVNIKGGIFPIILLSIISHIWTALRKPQNVTWRIFPLTLFAPAYLNVSKPRGRGAYIPLLCI